jgi:hypothetical protein
VVSMDRLAGLVGGGPRPGQGERCTGGVGEAVGLNRAAGPDGMGRPAA